MSLKQKKIEELETEHERLLNDLFRFKDAVVKAEKELQSARGTVSYVEGRLRELEDLLAALKE